jgi:hypothetical protein
MLETDGLTMYLTRMALLSIDVEEVPLGPVPLAGNGWWWGGPSSLTSPPRRRGPVQACAERRSYRLGQVPPEFIPAQAGTANTALPTAFAGRAAPKASTTSVDGLLLRC